MSDFLPLVAVFGGLAVILAGLVWLAFRVRRRGAAGIAVGGALAAWEESFRVTSHESYHEIRVEAERRIPVLSPDGGGNPGSPLTRDSGRRPQLSSAHRRRWIPRFLRRAAAVRRR